MRLATHGDANVDIVDMPTPPLGTTGKNDGKATTHGAPGTPRDTNVDIVDITRHDFCGPGIDVLYHEENDINPRKDERMEFLIWSMRLVSVALVLFAILSTARIIMAASLRRPGDRETPASPVIRVVPGSAGRERRPTR